jgi:hypothetical protein
VTKRDVHAASMRVEVRRAIASTEDRVLGVARMAERLDDMLAEFTDDSPDASVLFSDAPITSIIQRRQFQALCLMVSCFYGTLAAFWIRRMQSNGVNTFQHYRLSILELRSHAACVRGREGENETKYSRLVELGRFGMLFDARDARYRMHEERKMSQVWIRGALITSFDEPVPTNGFYFMTATEGSNVACDPVRFAVHGTNLRPHADNKCLPTDKMLNTGLPQESRGRCSSVIEEDDRAQEDAVPTSWSQVDEGTAWSQVGSSSFAFDRRPSGTGRDAFIYIFEDGEFGTSSLRAHLHAFDLSSPVFKIGLCAGSCMACALGTAGAAVFGYLRKPKLGKSILSQAILVNFMGHLLQITFDGRHVIAHVICSGSCAALCFFGNSCNFCKNALLTFGTWTIIGLFGDNLYLFLVGFLGTLYWAKSLFWWQKSKSVSALIVQADQARYDMAWQHLLLDPFMSAEIDAMHAICKQLPGGSEAYPHPQHHFYPGESNAVRGGREEGLTEPATVEVCSLDHAYSQAAVVHPMLMAKVEILAVCCHGSLCLVPNLKNALRAIQKIVRCYNRNVSFLVDICRHSLAFESIEDLKACLMTLCDDPEMEVVRVKNRMHHTIDSISTGGYRDVLVNGRFTNEVAVRYGVDRHIFEILLILKPFADLKTAEGHRNYQMFRDLRAE